MLKFSEREYLAVKGIEWLKSSHVPVEKVDKFAMIYSINFLCVHDLVDDEKARDLIALFKEREKEGDAT